MIGVRTSPTKRASAPSLGRLAVRQHREPALVPPSGSHLLGSKWLATCSRYLGRAESDPSNGPNSIGVFRARNPREVSMPNLPAVPNVQATKPGLYLVTTIAALATALLAS